MWIARILACEVEPLHPTKVCVLHTLSVLGPGLSGTATVRLGPMRKGVSVSLYAGLVLVAAVAVAAGLLARQAGTLGSLERALVDARFSLRGGQRPAPGVVLVGVDDESLGDLPRPPLPRALHAQVLDRLHSAGARLIVYDVAFDKATGPEDEALLEAAGRAAPVVVATSEISPTGQTPVLGGEEVRAQLHDRAGASYLAPDADGVLRHTVDRVHGLPTLAAAAMLALGRPASSLAQMRGGWIDYAGPAGTFPALSFEAVLKGRFDPARVRGKIVVVGFTAPALLDVHPTPTSPNMPGPEIQANAIATALAGFPLRSPSAAIAVLTILALALLPALLALRFEALTVALACLGVLLLWLAAGQVAFDAGSVLDLSDPLAALLVGAVGSVLAVMAGERRERRELRLRFAAGEGDVVRSVLGAEPHGLGPQSVIAGYRLERPVGHGGMGVVYRATQLDLDRPVALKLIAADHAQDDTFRARFNLESRLAASIEHANVIPVYEAGEDDGLLFIVMRLVDGTDLAHVLHDSGALEVARTVRLIAQLAAALDAAHTHGLVHQDVKPANVLLTSDQPEHLYLTDFGVAKHIGGAPDTTTHAQWVGTIDYIAPEQIRGESVGPAADIYALAGVLHSCLTGSVPFPRENEAARLWAHVNAPPPAPAELNGRLPRAVDMVIARGMAKDPCGRYPTGLALAQACAAALGINLPESIPTTTAIPGARASSHPPTVISA